MGDPASHEEIAEKFQKLRSQAAQLANRLNDLAAERMVRCLILSHHLEVCQETRLSAIGQQEMTTRFRTPAGA